ncbi:MAG: ComEA family DNA-binding protein [Burkholderiaceae bacterium]|nr:ComEA family DNA-binding protein [Gammaproteobacteria bacterium]
MIRTSLRAFIALCLFLPWLAFAGPVDVNTASADQLAEALNGVGPSKAAAIVAHRAQHGPYRSHQDLARVKGIGENLVQKNQALIRFGEAEPATKK